MRGVYCRSPPGSSSNVSVHPIVWLSYSSQDDHTRAESLLQLDYISDVKTTCTCCSKILESLKLGCHPDWDCKSAIATVH